MPTGYPDWGGPKFNVWIAQDWAVFRGQQKIFWYAISMPANSSYTFDVYTVPQGKILLVNDVVVASKDDSVSIYALLVDNTTSQPLVILSDINMAKVVFKVPRIIPAGHVLTALLKNRSAVDTTFMLTIGCLEVDESGKV